MSRSSRRDDGCHDESLLLNAIAAAAIEHRQIERSPESADELDSDADADSIDEAIAGWCGLVASLR